MKPEKQVATQASSAMAEYDDLVSGTNAGTENMGAGDFRPPRLSVAQNNTPQRIKSSPDYLPGLEEGQLFNSLTGEIYGINNEDVKICVVSYLGARAMEFDADGNIVDFNVALNDPRLQFSDGPNGRRVKPAATKFMDYLILVTEGGEMVPELVAWSAKSLAIKQAMNLNSLLRSPLRVEGLVIPTPPAWARTFRVSVVESHRDKFTFYELRFLPAGVTPPDIRKMAADLYEQHHDSKLERRDGCKGGFGRGERRCRGCRR